MNRKSIFVNEACQIGQVYHHLAYEERGDIPVVFGNIELRRDGECIDSYEIEIHYREGYPYIFPLLFETGGKIPKNIDWHIFESTGNCCLKAFPEEILICKKGITLINFIEHQVIPYLFHQTFRRENGFFLRERSHGQQGFIEFFKDVLKSQNIINIIHSLNFVLKRNEPNRVADCFCGSGKKYRNCHKDSYNVLSEFSNYDLAHFIKELKNSNEYQMTLLKLISV